MLNKTLFDLHSDVKSNLVFTIHNGKEPRFSFLIPTCNREDCLFRALDSINNQTDCNYDFAVLIIDNNPFVDVDDLKTKLSKYKKLTIDYYVNDKNIGMFGNWNRGISLCKTNIISMLHDDDTVFPDYYKRVLMILKKYDFRNIAYVKMSSIDIREDGIKGKGKLIGKIFKNRLIKENQKTVAMLGNPAHLGAPSCGSLLLKKAIEDIGGYDENNYPSSDVFLVYQLMKKGLSVFYSLGYFGYRYFGKNESSKYETVRQWVIKYNQFRNEQFNDDKKLRKIVDRYFDVQYVYHVQLLLSTPTSDGVSHTLKDFDDIYKVSFNKRKLFFFKIKLKMNKYRNILLNLMWRKK